MKNNTPDLTQIWYLAFLFNVLLAATFLAQPIQPQDDNDATKFENPDSTVPAEQNLLVKRSIH